MKSLVSWTTLARRTHRALIDAIQTGREEAAYYYTLGLCHVLLHTAEGWTGMRETP